MKIINTFRGKSIEERLARQSELHRRCIILIRSLRGRKSAK